MKAYSDIFGSSEKALRLRTKRMELIAGNIANADSVNFKSKSFDFKTIMRKELAPSESYTATMEHLEGRVKRIREALKRGSFDGSK